MYLTFEDEIETTNVRAGGTERQQLPVDAETPLDGIKRSIQSRVWYGFLSVFAIMNVVFSLYTIGFYVRLVVQNKLYAWDIINPGMYHRGQEYWLSNFRICRSHGIGIVCVVVRHAPIRAVDASSRRPQPFVHPSLERPSDDPVQHPVVVGCDVLHSQRRHVL